VFIWKNLQNIYQIKIQIIYTKSLQPNDKNFFINITKINPNDLIDSDSNNIYHSIIKLYKKFINNKFKKLAF
jgi:hypothetical protein